MVELKACLSFSFILFFNYTILFRYFFVILHFYPTILTFSLLQILTFREAYKHLI